MINKHVGFLPSFKSGARGRAGIVLMAAILLTALYVRTVRTETARPQVAHPEARLTVELRMNATEQEVQEAYFAFGTGKTGMMVIPYPNSGIHEYLRAHVGQRFQVIFIPLED